MNLGGKAKSLLDCFVLHTAGDGLGKNMVTNTETVRFSHEYYSRGKRWNWDTNGEFEVSFGCSEHPVPYYTHVLFPEDYIQDI